MRLIGYLLMTIALCAGTLAATTAYVPRLDPPAVEGLTLNAVAGIATAENNAVLDHAALTPTYAVNAVSALRDTKRGKPRIEMRFAIGSDTTVSLDHPGDVGLIVVASAGAMTKFAEELGLEDVSGPMLIARGLSPAQITELTEPKPTEKDDGSFTAVMPSNAIPLSDGVAVPLTVRTGVSPLASLSQNDLYALAATYAIDPDLRAATLARLYPNVAASRAQALEDLQSALDEEFPPKDDDVKDSEESETPADESEAEDPVGPSLHMAENGRLVTGEDASSKDLVPIGHPRDILTTGLMSALGDSGAERVRVKEFSIARWEYAWLLGAAVVAMLIGVFMVRRETKKIIAQSVADAHGSSETPEAAMRRISACLDRALACSTPHDLLVPLTEIQRDHFNAIIDARNLLVGRMGLGGYAEFMDEFSSMERQINRAWSAAADNAVHESMTAVQRAHEMAPAVQAHLDASA